MRRDTPAPRFDRDRLRAGRRRSTPWAVPALLLAAWLLVPAASLAQPGDLALAPFPDVTGASGESQAVFLNPAAATELGQAAVGLWVSLPQEGVGSGPLYGLTLLDPGITLAGGLVVTAQPRAAGEPVSLSYAVAGRLGAAALGIRPVWTRTADGSGRWTLDAGLAWHPTPWVSLGVSGLDLPLRSGEALPGRGLAGITVTATPLQGTLLEGAQLALGVADADLDDEGGLMGRVGLRLPVGPTLRLALGYQMDLETGERAGWGGTLGVSLGHLRLEWGYESDPRYRVGLELGW